MKPELTEMPPPPDTPARAAAHWMALRKSGELSAHDEREFQVWFEGAPENTAAYQDLEGYWQATGMVADDPEIMALTELRARQFNRPASNLKLAAMAACAAMLVFGGWSVVSFDLLPERNQTVYLHEEAYRTKVGESATVRLPDGTVVTLDTDTVLTVRDTDRRRFADLERGRAYFRVAKDASRPFVVNADGRKVTATGTAFDVRVDKEGMAVTLAEGAVRVEEPSKGFMQGQYTNLRAGWRLTIPAGKDWQASRIDVLKETAWVDGRLNFINEPLGHVVEEMNRYSERKLVIRDAHLAKEPVVGVFKAGDVEGFVAALKLYGLARPAVSTAEFVELEALS